MISRSGGGLRTCHGKKYGGVKRSTTEDIPAREIFSYVYYSFSMLCFGRAKRASIASALGSLYRPLFCIWLLEWLLILLTSIYTLLLELTNVYIFAPLFEAFMPVAFRPIYLLKDATNPVQEEGVKFGPGEVSSCCAVKTTMARPANSKQLHSMYRPNTKGLCTYARRWQ